MGGTTRWLGKIRWLGRIVLTTWCYGYCCGADPTSVWAQEATDAANALGQPALHRQVSRRSVCYVPRLNQESPSSGAVASFNRQLPKSWFAATPARLYGLTDQTSTWEKYQSLWRAHADDPGDQSIRRYFGFPLGNTSRQQTRRSGTWRRGRARVRDLDWRPGSYWQFDSDHFRILSRADRESTQQIARELEQCYWVWTQMFFPLWEGAAQVSAHLENWSQAQSIARYLEQLGKRLTIQRKLRVVLFADRQQYVQTLGRRQPGIEQSTGYYDDGRRTTYLFATEASPHKSAASADQTVLETLRHELVHQLFREATATRPGRSKTSASRPGEQRDFWLVEGIAGYFESMVVRDGVATVGGWDSPRLQFARFRTVAGGESLPLAQLRPEGRLAVQLRTDLPRWYAHSIAHTHRLMDAGQPATRQWCLGQLADLYAVATPLPKTGWTIRATGSLSSAVALDDFLRLNGRDFAADPTIRKLRQLCLAGCQLTEGGLENVGPLENLDWLDLSRTKVDTQFVLRWIPDPSSLRQLSLEVTSVNDDLAAWLGRAKNLTELDLSWTGCGDQTLKAVGGHTALSTLWLTGSKVSDQSIDTIAAIRSLKSVDVQRSGVTNSGISRLKKLRPNLNINPIQLSPSR